MGVKSTVAATPTGFAAAFNHQEPHLRTLLGFIGISDVQFIHAEGLDKGPESRTNGLAPAKSMIEQVLGGRADEAAFAAASYY